VGQAVGQDNQGMATRPGVEMEEEHSTQRAQDTV
jgi:hypothetical protein